MDSKQQNAGIEILASFSLLGGRQLDYRDTPISETSAAIASDPLRHGGRLPDSWIEAADPKDDAGREVLRLLDRAKERYSRDMIDHPKRPTRVANDDDNSYLPGPDEDFSVWLARIAAAVDVNDSNKKSLFDVLKSYVAKFPTKKFSDLNESQRDTLAKLVEFLCAEVA
jgi:hypothetical protein